MRFLDRLAMALEGVTIAFEAIRGNKVRASLTISGVAVGVFVVVAMAAAVHGIRQSFQNDLDEFGATTFQISRRDPGSNQCNGPNDPCPDRKNPPLSLDEFRSIQELPEVGSAVASISNSGTVTYKSQQVKSVGYDAYTTDWIKTDRADIFPGRSFTDGENNGAAAVIIVNDSLKSQLFGDSDPIGKTVQLDGTPFSVIGVFHTKAGFLKTISGRGPDQARAIVPFMTAWRHLNVFKRGISVAVMPTPAATRDEAMDAVTAILRGKRGLKPGQRNSFYLIGSDRIMDVFNQFFGAIFLVGLTLSAVGLLVGGVGVVAIMMISVTERTREIGVRKALGATRGIILWQFLVEAATLTTLGAAIGLVIGALLAWVVKANTPIPASVPPSAVAISLLSAALTGIAFGMMPAARAARMDPVEALRHE
ncbi:MAG: ABC transporter permease [Gemmatimonadales bacterium]